MSEHHGELILYRTEDGRTDIHLRAAEGTAWLSQGEMADLFETSKQNISLHIRKIFAEGELSEDAVVKFYLTTAADGKRYKTMLYRLDLILAVGERYAAFDARRRAIEADAAEQEANEDLKQLQAEARRLAPSKKNKPQP